MTSTTTHWKLGLFVVTGIAVILGTAFWIGIERLRRDYAVWHAYFNEAVDGLATGSPVKFLGVPIGEVAEIGGGPPGYEDWVKVTAHLYLEDLAKMGMYDPNVQVPVSQLAPPNLRVRLISSALTGVTFIQAFFDDVNPRPNYPFATSDRTVISVPSTLETLSKGLQDTLARMPALADNASRLMVDLDESLLELDLRDISRRTRDLLTAAEEKIAALDTGGLSAESLGALEDIRAFVDELRGDEGAVDRIVSRLDELAGALEGAVRQADLASTTGSFRSAGTSVAQAGAEFTALGRDLRADVGLLRETLESVRRLADLLERDPGSLIHGRTPRGPVRRNN